MAHELQIKEHYIQNNLIKRIKSFQLDWKRFIKRTSGQPCVFPSGPNKITLVEDIEILQSFKFRLILLSVFSEEAENVYIHTWRRFPLHRFIWVSELR